MSKPTVSSSRKQGNSPFRASGPDNSQGKSIQKIQFYSSQSKNVNPQTLKLVSELFQTIAIEESDIERLRQVFSHMREFTSNQKLLFKEFDKDGDNKISSKELLAFMQDNLIKGATVEDCELIISEFDSTLDGHLNFEEFLNVFLPAADYNVRNIEFVQDPRSKSDPSLPSSVSSMAARILEREKSFHQKRKAARAALQKESESTLSLVFHLLSKGKTEIKMEDLIQFLDQQGFYAKTEDLEAILRRCDHDADRSISFEEFAEILGRDYDQLIAEREKLVELAAQSRKEEYERIKKEQEQIRLQWERKLETEKIEREKRLEEQRNAQERQRLDLDRQIEKEKWERESRIQETRKELERSDYEKSRHLEQWRIEKDRELERVQRAQESRRLEIESQSGFARGRQIVYEQQIYEPRSVPVIGVPNRQIYDQSWEARDRFLQNGRVEISGSFNIREYEKKLQAENGQSELERQRQLEQWRIEKEQELERVKIQYESRRLEIEKEMEIQKIERERRLQEERLEQERLELERQREIEIWKQEREREIKKSKIEEESRKREIEKQIEIEKYERESRITNQIREREIIRDTRSIREDDRKSFIQEARSEFVEEQQREYIPERRERYVAPQVKKQYVERRVVRKVISPVPQQIQTFHVPQQVVRRVRREASPKKVVIPGRRIASAVERTSQYRDKSAEIAIKRREVEEKIETQKIERARKEEEKKVQMEQWKLEREKQIEQAKIEQQIKRQEYERQLEIEKIERETKIVELRQEQEKIRFEKEQELEIVKQEREQQVEQAKIEYESRLKELQVEKERIQIEIEKKKEEVILNIESKKIDIEKQLEDERIQREEDHIAWKLEQERLRLEKEREEEWERLQREQELEEQRKNEELERVEQEKLTIIQRIEREKMIEEYKIQKLTDEAAKAQQEAFKAIEREKKLEEAKIERERIRIEKETQVKIWRLEKGESVKKVEATTVRKEVSEVASQGYRSEAHYGEQETRYQEARYQDEDEYEVIEEEQSSQYEQEEVEEVVEYVQQPQPYYQSKPIAAPCNNAYWIEEYRMVPQFGGYAQQPQYQTQVVQQPVEYRTEMRVVRADDKYAGYRSNSREGQWVPVEKFGSHTKSRSGLVGLQSANIVKKIQPTKVVTYGGKKGLTQANLQHQDDTYNYMNESQYQQ